MNKTLKKNRGKNRKINKTKRKLNRHKTKRKLNKHRNKKTNKKSIQRGGADFFTPETGRSGEPDETIGNPLQILMDLMETSEEEAKNALESNGGNLERALHSIMMAKMRREAGADSPAADIPSAVGTPGADSPAADIPSAADTPGADSPAADWEKIDSPSPSIRAWDLLTSGLDTPDKEGSQETIDPNKVHLGTVLYTGDRERLLETLQTYTPKFDGSHFYPIDQFNLLPINTVVAYWTEELSPKSETQTSDSGQNDYLNAFIRAPKVTFGVIKQGSGTNKIIHNVVLVDDKFLIESLPEKPHMGMVVVSSIIDIDLETKIQELKELRELQSRKTSDELNLEIGKLNSLIESNRSSEKDQGVFNFEADNEGEIYYLKLGHLIVYEFPFRLFDAANVQMEKTKIVEDRKNSIYILTIKAPLGSYFSFKLRKSDFDDLLKKLQEKLETIEPADRQRYAGDLLNRLIERREIYNKYLSQATDRVKEMAAAFIKRETAHAIKEKFLPDNEDCKMITSNNVLEREGICDPTNTRPHIKCSILALIRYGFLPDIINFFIDKETELYNSLTAEEEKRRWVELITAQAEQIETEKRDKLSSITGSPTLDLMKSSIEYLDVSSPKIAEIIKQDGGLTEPTTRYMFFKNMISSIGEILNIGKDIIYAIFSMIKRGIKTMAINVLRYLGLETFSKLLSELNKEILADFVGNFKRTKGPLNQLKIKMTQVGFKIAKDLLKNVGANKSSQSVEVVHLAYDTYRTCEESDVMRIINTIRSGFIDLPTILFHVISILSRSVTDKDIDLTVGKVKSFIDNPESIPGNILNVLKDVCSFIMFRMLPSEDDFVKSKLESKIKEDEDLLRKTVTLIKELIKSDKSGEIEESEPEPQPEEPQGEEIPSLTLIPADKGVEDQIPVDPIILTAGVGKISDPQIKQEAEILLETVTNLHKQLTSGRTDYEDGIRKELSQEYNLLKTQEDFDKTFSKRIKASNEARDLWDNLCHELAGCNVDTQTPFTSMEKKVIAKHNMDGGIRSLKELKETEELQKYAKIITRWAQAEPEA